MSCMLSCSVYLAYNWDLCFNCLGTRYSDDRKIKRRQQKPRDSTFTQIISTPPTTTPPPAGKMGTLQLQDGVSAWRRECAGGLRVNYKIDNYFLAVPDRAPGPEGGGCCGCPPTPSPTPLPHPPRQACPDPTLHTVHSCTSPSKYLVQLR